MIKVKFSYRHVTTGAVVKGERRFKGGSFFAIVDRIRKALEDDMPDFLRRQHYSGEELLGWEINGFQDWKVWNDRKLRAIAAQTEGGM